MKPKLVIGIDPGKSTGYAEFDVDSSRVIRMGTMDFWGVYKHLETMYRNATWVNVVIEVPNTKHVWHKGAVSEAAKNRTAVNVGSVIREAELLAQGIETLGIHVTRVPPKGKVDATKFKSFTGLEGVTNQHERDAVIMAIAYARRLK
jgi:hypothetical protein